MELAKAYVQIVPSAKGIKGNIEKAIGGDVESAGASAGASFGKNLVGTLGKVVAAAGIGKIIKDSISEGANYEQLTGGVETLFKDSADVVMKYSQEAYKTAGMSANQYMETATSSAAAMISSLQGDTVKAAELTNMAVMDMSDNANKMGSDMSSIQTAYAGFAKGNFTMLDNLKLGYGGTKTEMERLLAKAEEIQRQQGIAVDYSIDSYADIVQAIHVVSDEMGIIGTTAAEAEKTVSGSLSMMKSSWTNLLMAISSGQDVRQAFAQLSDSARTFAGNIIPMIGTIVAQLPDLISELLRQVVLTLNRAAYEFGNTPGIFEAGLRVVLGLVNAITSNIPYIIESAWNLARKFFEAFATTDYSTVISDFLSEFSNNLYQMAGEIFGADDANGIIPAITNSIRVNLPFIVASAGDVITEFVTGLLDKLPSIFDSATEIIGSLIDGLQYAIPNVISAAGAAIATFIAGIMDKLPAIMESAGKMITTLIQGVSNMLPKVAVAITRVMKQILVTIAEHMPQILQSGIKLVAEIAAGIIRAIPKIVAAIPQVIKVIWDGIKQVDWLSLGGAIISGIISGIHSMGSALWDAITDIASRAFGAVKSFFGISSPSKLMRDEIGRWIPLGIAEGIEGNTNTLTNAMQDMAAEVASSYDMNVLMNTSVGSASGESSINYGGITINVQADSVQKSKDFVDWLERQLVVRQKSRSAVFA